MKILKKLREERGYTQEYMAERLGYKGKSGYCLLEKGSIKLTVEKAIAISRILDIDPSIFFENKVEETSTEEESEVQKIV